jgi:hypothetical protein
LLKLEFGCVGKYSQNLKNAALYLIQVNSFVLKFLFFSYIKKWGILKSFVYSREWFLYWTMFYYFISLFDSKNHYNSAFFTEVIKVEIQSKTNYKFHFRNFSVTKSSLFSTRQWALQWTGKIYEKFESLEPVTNPLVSNP